MNKWLLIALLCSSGAYAVEADFTIYHEYSESTKENGEVSNSFFGDGFSLDNQFLTAMYADISAHQYGMDFFARGRLAYIDQSQRNPLLNARRENDIYEHNFNELYIGKDYGDVSFSLGRKKVRWGVAYVLSPTDLVSEGPPANDPDDRSFSLQGSDLLQASFVISDESLLDVFFIPSTPLNDKFITDDAVAFRWYNYLYPFDVALVGRFEGSDRNSIGANAAVTIGDGLEIHAEYLYQSDNLNQYPDAASVTGFSRRNESASEILLGTQWSPSRNWNFIVEYLHLSGGYSDDDWNNLIGAGRSAALTGSSNANFDQILGDSLTRRENYLFFRALSKRVIEEIDVEFISLYGTDDDSSLNRISFGRKVSTFGELFFRYSFTEGGTDTEFGQAVNADGVAIIDFTYKF